MGRRKLASAYSCSRISLPQNRLHESLVYWIKGRPRRCLIGSWPEWSVTAARDRAKALCRETDEGQDPLEQRRDDHEAPRVSN